MRADPLQSLNIMLFDPDRNSASVTKLAMQTSEVSYRNHSRELEEGIEAHQASPFDIILVDLTGESMELSIQFIRSIRAIPKEEAEPPKIVALLGQGTEDALRTCIGIGADTAWVKPISPKTIRKRMEHVVNLLVPYYQAENYYGPDRRRLPDNGSYDGDEKRS